MSSINETALLFKIKLFESKRKKQWHKQKHAGRRNKEASGKESEVKMESVKKEHGGKGGQIREHFTP